MSVLPILAARVIIRKLIRAITSRITSIPLHGGKDIGRGLLRKIVKQAGLTVKEFLDF